MAIWRDLSVMDILDDGCGEISNVSNNPYSQRRVIFYLMSWQAMRRRLWYKESPKIANRITENCKSGESGFFELSFLFI